MMIIVSYSKGVYDVFFFFFSSRRRHTRLQGDWSSDVCSSDLNAIEAVRRIADFAGERGVTLGLEVVNRYESNLLNTAAQALEFIDEVGQPHVCVHLDTYHMNIEEADLAEIGRAHV